MKAARSYGGKDIRLETLPEPVPDLDEVLVKVKATGICGSELHGYHAKTTAPQTPRTGGHELAGEVVALGERVTKHKIGDRVAVEPIIPCNDCPECLSGNYNICSQLEHIGSIARGGGFAEYTVAPEDNVYTLPDNISFEAGALTEVYAVAVHALSLVPVRPGDSVAVIGSGPIGLSIAQMADIAGASSVAVLGKPDGPLKLAEEMIGVVPINVDKTEPLEAVRTWTGGKGANVIFEAVGGTAPTLQQATEISAKRGRICMVGGHTVPLTLDTRYARSRELSITWCFCYGRRDGKKEFQIALELMGTKKFEPTSLITHRFSLDDINEAFAVAAGREQYGSVKVIVLP
ncbi:alcohol dehydrogenase catalytic domain-containing protein [bacterium]|nr:alcohol dehydrogenase catalytic domain-containing protein [bacterium]